MKAIIVEDDFIVADHLQMMLAKHGVSVLKIVDNVEEAVHAMQLEPNFYFVDIRLNGEKTGVDLGMELKQMKIPFVYVTANNEMSTLKAAAKSSPLAYITKPYKENDIIALLEMLKTYGEQTIEVKTNYGKKQIKLSEVLYFQSDGSYLEIITDKEKYTERNSLSVMEERYGDLFIRVHRSYLVNKEYIGQYNAKYVFIGEEAIPISRTYKEQLREELN